jgi:glycogenin glucosyltransferase
LRLQEIEIMVVLDELPSKPYAFVTWVNNDYYALGALVLGHSLRRVGTKHILHLMYSDGISEHMLELLKTVYDDASSCTELDSKDKTHLNMIHRPELGVTFTKLHVWRLTQYSKCVYLDSDTLVAQNVDDMFDRPEFAAVTDLGWPDFFNSGVFVFEPSDDTYRSILDFAVDHGTWDGGDQGLLNNYFSDWRKMDESHRLPFTYNVCPTAALGYKAALKKVAGDIKIIHFMGHHKPWQHKGVTPMAPFWALWHYIYHHKVREHVPAKIYAGPSEDEHLQSIKLGLPDYRNFTAYLDFQKIVKETLHKI